ncbi:MAG: hypothetical protein DMG61_08380 [Acidobacteria bacterium]|nr:MAG: hypothetical protein DMG61_08380 [Acidobacteriota bacterium]
MQRVITRSIYTVSTRPDTADDELCVCVLLHGPGCAEGHEGAFLGRSRRVTSLILSGVGLLGVAQLCSALLPIPKSLPIDRFFRSTHAAWVLAVFGILVGPFYEELLFRGFLFPALRRYLPLVASIVIDGLLFALYHGPQLAWSWAPMLLIFVVGSVLTIVRARTGWLGSAFLGHSAYSAFDFVLICAASDGFRHMHKLR